MDNKEEQWYNLISKKDLLDKYSISYGALYRWKRKGLIPEEWFIKKATVTGQETFFPERIICERIELIQGLKEDVLLDELAKKLNAKEKAEASITLYLEYGKKTFNINDISKIEICDRFKKCKDVTELILKQFDEIYKEENEGE